jgi:hypothetical protein
VSDLLGVLRQKCELVEIAQFVIGDFRHGSTLRTAEIQVLSARHCVSVDAWLRD